MIQRANTSQQAVPQHTQQTDCSVLLLLLLLLLLVLAAARRDFTINALYYDPASGAVLDFVGGVTDAQQRVLRLTGEQGIAATTADCSNSSSNSSSSATAEGAAPHR
jgi:hypothetical protein